MWILIEETVHDCHFRTSPLSSLYLQVGRKRRLLHTVYRLSRFPEPSRCPYRTPFHKWNNIRRISPCCRYMCVHISIFERNEECSPILISMLCQWMLFSKPYILISYNLYEQRGASFKGRSHTMQLPLEKYITVFMVIFLCNVKQHGSRVKLVRFRFGVDN
jgi:hypothetical protein